MRWTGAAVGKLQAGDEIMHPRVRLIADEHLTGAPRDAVEARLNAWLKSHIDKMLGPLAQLAAAEDVTGIARGVAFQLVEALGVLDRQRVAEDVKGLEQPARASLRKYGVRFGAYHIYLPLLLKPAPRTLAAQLWALRHDGPQSKGLDDLLHLAGSGRTSMPVNREIDPVLYRTAGYRVCGERAVRVDILERLADLVRPALSWREGISPKPAGAIAGGGFTIVSGMTSLIGASGEDFASILRSLGYRMERRPKPPEPAAPAAGEPATEPSPLAPIQEAVVAGAAEAAEPSGETAAAPIEISAVPIEDVETTAETVVAIDVESPVVDAEIVPSPIQELPPEPQPSEVVESAPAAEADAGVVQAESVENTTPAEPVMIEVWRPGRSEGANRARQKQRDRRRPRRTDTAPPRRAEEPVAAASAGEAAPLPSIEQTEPAGAVAPKQEERHPRHRRRHAGDHRQDRPQRDRDGRNAIVTGRQSSASNGVKRRPIRIRRSPSSLP